MIAVICLHLSSKAKFGHDPVVGAFAVGPEEVATAKEPAAADLGRRCATHVPNMYEIIVSDQFRLLDMFLEYLETQIMI